MNSPVLCLVIILIVIIIIIVIVGIANYSNTNSQCNNFKNKKMQRRRGKFMNGGISCPSGYVATYSKIPVNCTTGYTATNGASYQACSEITTSMCIPTVGTVATTMPITVNTVITSPYYPPSTVTTSLMYPPATVATIPMYPPVTGTVATGGGGGGGRMRGGGGVGRMRGGMMRGGMMRGGMRGGGGMRGRKGGFANGATICPAGSTIVANRVPINCVISYTKTYGKSYQSCSYTTNNVCTPIVNNVAPACPTGSTVSLMQVPNCIITYTKTYGKSYQSCNNISISECVPIVNMRNALPAAEHNALLYLQHVK